MNQLAPLRYLIALAEHRHFGRAAQACHITQPALSNALKALEEELGVAVVRRGRSFVGFTPEGERLLDGARRVLHEVDGLTQELRASQAHPVGRLRIGVVPTAVPVAARFAARLQALHGGIFPVVRALSSQEIESGLLELSLDLGLGFIERLQGRNTGLACCAQYEESFYLLSRREVTQPAGQVPGGAVIGWAEAARLPLCLLTPEMHNRSLVDAAFERAGATACVVMETNSVVTLAPAVMAGQVHAVVPGAMIPMLAPVVSLQVRRLADPDARTSVGFMFLDGDRLARTLSAALELARAGEWRAELEGVTGRLGRAS